MNVMRKSKQNSATCDCREGVEVSTPINIFNRPGLDSVGFRVGTHGSFLETMEARLSSHDFPRLAALTTRESRDASIALLDAWATVADVLTFYQERIANEGYLRTATERRSVLELARLVGYRLRPGLSASVYLAYTLEPTQETTIIEVGNKAQSIPGPNELPQIFETAEKLIAYSALNLMKPRLAQPQFLTSPSFQEITTVVKGTSLNLRINDGMLLEFKMLSSAEVHEAFYRISDVTTETQKDRTIINLKLDGPVPGFDKTLKIRSQVLLASVKSIEQRYTDIDAFGLSSSSKTVKKIVDLVKAFSSKASALVADTSIIETDKPPKIGADVEVLLPEVSSQYTFASARGWDNIAAWLEALIAVLEELKKSTAASLTSDNQKSEGERGAPGLPSFVELFEPFKLPQALQPNGEAHLTRNVLNIFSPRSEFVGRMYAAINPQAAQFVGAVLSNASVTNAPESTSKGEGVIALSKGDAFRLRVSIAGHNLPVIIKEQLDQHGAIVSGSVATTVSPPSLSDYFKALNAAGFSSAKAGSDLNLIALDGEYSQIKIGSRVVIQHPAPTGITTSIHIVDNVTPTELTFVGVPIKTSVLTLRTSWLPKAESQDDTALASNALVRTTAVFAQNEELTLAETELSEVLSFSPNDPNLIELDGFYPNLESGRWTIISGERIVIDTQTKLPVNTGVIVSELLMVASVAHEAKTLINGVGVEVKDEKVHTFLRPAQLPAYSYRRSTAKVYGNVIRATHGETRNEVLGSGEGSKAFQAFQLLQPPLTYLAAPVPSGTESTLAVRINDVLWSESDNLFALGPNVRKYTTNTDDDGKTSVIFGDGEHGSRLPTGIENVKAVYRQGLGKGGNVKAEQIKLPLTKPLGVKSVINPMQASGGVDKETRDQARRNVPIAVLALDRLVSVQDYADFARTFAGIAKASAQRLSEGQREIVHLTIAGAGNIPIDVTSDLYRNLVTSLGRFGDPLQPLEVESFERVLLVVSAKVSVLPEYLWEKVKANLRATLWEKLGFENRELGQGVTMSEVVSLMQAVSGVDYVDLDLLDSVSEKTLKDPDFGVKLSLRRRVNAHLARMNQQKNDILPAQLLFLSQDAIDTLILEEIPA